MEEFTTKIDQEIKSMRDYQIPSLALMAVNTIFYLFEGGLKPDNPRDNQFVLEQFSRVLKHMSEHFERQALKWEKIEKDQKVLRLQQTINSLLREKKVLF